MPERLNLCSLLWWLLQIARFVLSVIIGEGMAGCGRVIDGVTRETYGRDPGGQAAGHSLSVDIVVQIAQRHHGELIVAQMGDIALELIGIGVDPGVVELGGAVEGEYRDASVAGLL